MRITFKLYATLGEYLPSEGRIGNVVQLDVPATTTIVDLVEQHRLPPRLVHLVLVNGVFVPPAERATRVLQPDDVLAIWPPVAGG
ncbi:sulfur carrier protein ThiS [Leptothrix discophora]|uniref:MoaD/ThiS family protein n=1 Tax=Leptothrix discophora TaxID=89 RepID=A0ABT9FZN3_LEPDI|nr:MoaD/ThiS family protein [Leptothrix discophora]MDP4299621.1 MoaD/ThiS family protein [Leptothrix discophora]